MPVLLKLDSSADFATSRTRALTAAFADAWTSRGADHTVVTRDLARDQLPHLVTPAQHWPERLRGGAAVPAELETLQESVIAELLAADVVLIGAPMYNYSMPSTLKAWIDLVHVPGVTAAFDVQTRPMAGRHAVVVSARGAAYDAGTPQASWDHVTPPLALVLGNGLGMEVDIVTTSRTLADRVEALQPALAAEQFEAALAECRRLGAAL